MTDRQLSSPSFYEEEDTPHHYGFVIGAVIISVIIHAVLMHKASDFRFSVTTDVDKTLLDKYDKQPPSRIDSLPDDPEQPVENPLFGDPSATPSIGIQAAVDELASRPDTAFSAPRISDQALSVAKEVPVSLPTPQPITEGWQPRQEVIEVVDRLVRDDVSVMPRLEVPAIERVSDAPDYAPPVKMTDKRFDTVALPFSPLVLPEISPVAPALAVPEEVTVNATPTPEAQTPEVTISRFGEKPKDISSFTPVDSRLAAKVQVFRPAGKDVNYFRLEVAARDRNVLPVVPKDVVFVQDASRSLAEERLYFCRKALNEAIRSLPPQDRFNVVLFRENAEFCFDGWVSPNDATITQASAFIDAMKSRGDTDVFESMKAILGLPRDAARPLIIILITDGKATKGLTESSRIIGEFSKLNDNTSVFAIGTHGKSNNYLLDLLSFCNRGDADIAPSRYDLGKTIASVIEGCSQPVLGNIGVTTAIEANADIFPLPSANLYANRTLEYYGSCPAELTNLVFQVRGEGGKSKCDIIFQMDLANAEAGGNEVHDAWARRRMHSLIGEYARNPSPELLKAIRLHSAETGLPIPYLSEIVGK